MMNITDDIDVINVTTTFDITSALAANTTTTFNETFFNITTKPAPPENVTSHVLTTVTHICNDSTTKKYTATTSHDALLYIVVVLLFYAFSMVILMVKYIRREKEEAEMAHYYTEFVSRERFKTPMFEVRSCMQGLKIKSARLGSGTAKYDDEEDDYVSCSDVPLVIKDQRLYIGEETKI